MRNPMERQDIKEAFLASLDTLAEDKKAIKRTAARATEIAEQVREIAEQSNKATELSSKATEQSSKTTEQIREMTEQISEIANLAVERMNSNEEQHQTLIQLVKALDPDL